MRTRCSWTALALAGAVFALPGTAQTVSLNRVVGTGDAVPGRDIPYVVFRAGSMWDSYNDLPGVFSRPAINDSGTVVFRGESCLLWDYNGYPGTGLYVREPNQPLRVLVDNTATSGHPTFAVPGFDANAQFNDFKAPLLNTAGDVVFWANFIANGNVQSGFFAMKVSGGTIVRLVDTITDDVPGYPGQKFDRSFAFGGTWQGVLCATLNDRGQVVFNGQFKIPSHSYQEDGLYATTVHGGPITRLVDVTGVVKPVDDSRYFSNIDDYYQPVLNNAGQLLFRGMVGSAVTGLYIIPVDGSSGARTAVLQNQATPQLSDGASRTWYSWFNGYDLNDAGQFVFYHSFDSSANVVGVFYGDCASGVPAVRGVLADSAGLCTLPGRPTATIKALGVPLINNAGAVSYFARGREGTTDLDSQCLAYLSGSPKRLVAIAGSIAPGREPSGIFTNFSSQTPALNEPGVVALSPIGQDGSRTIRGAWCYSTCLGGLARIVDDITATQAPPAGLGADITNSYAWIKLYDGFFARRGYYRSINKLNQVAFLAATNSSAGGIYVASVQLPPGTPTMTCPPDATREYPADTSPASTGTPTATDPCTQAALTPTFADQFQAGCGPTGLITRTWTASNAGQQATCTQLIHVVDTTAPALTVPTDVTIGCGTSTAPEATGQATATDAGDPHPAVSFSDAVDPGQCALEQVIHRTWTAQDVCGNVATGVQTITVRDTAAPTLTAPANQTVECGTPTDPGTTGTATAVDNCDAAPSVTFADVVTPGDCPAERVITRTWTAKDACNNVATAMQTITVSDATAPVLSVPNNATLECGADTSPTGTGQATATDNCDAAPQVTFSDTTTPGNCSGNYVITRTWTGTDACGNSASMVQTITVHDTTAPAITAPADVTVECVANTPPEGTGTPTVTDACDSAPTVTFSDATNAGVITRTWTATDACGNAASAIQTITVQDTIPPVLHVPADAEVACDANTSIGALGAATATDTCDPAPVVTHSDVTTTGNCAGRSVITRTWTATDAAHNSVSAVQTITLTDTTAPTITPPADATVECGGDTSPAALGSASAIDSCDPTPHIAYSDQGAAGVITRTWTATDACGNTATAVQTIRIADTAPPVISAPPNGTAECGADTSPGALGTATATDACDPAPAITHSDNTVPGGCPGNVVITRTWTATDAAHNSASAVQTITVTDTTPPVLHAPANVTVDCGGNTNPASTGTATATDACDPAPAVTYSDAVAPGIITRTWTARDACGNTTAAVQTITIADAAPPVITAPPDRTLQCGGDTSPAAMGTAAATDTCDPHPVITYHDAVVPGCGGTAVITRTWTATDAAHNSASAVQTISEVDTIPPVLTVNTTPIVVTDGDCSGGHAVALPAATATDNCGQPVTVTNNAPASFPAGQTTRVTFTATDACNNTATRQLDVTVKYGANVRVIAQRYVIGLGWHPYVRREALANAPIAAFPAGPGTCGRNWLEHHWSRMWLALPDIFTHCTPLATGVTGANGEITLNIPPGRYVIATTCDTQGSGIADLYVGEVVENVCCGQTATSRLYVMSIVGGKSMCGQWYRYTGSELIVVEPDHMEWDGQEQLYPFVFDADGEWGVTASVSPPEGFVADYPELSTEVMSQTDALQFTITEVGSDLVPTQTHFDITHKGQRYHLESRVGISLTPEYARTRGFDVEHLRANRLIAEPRAATRLQPASPPAAAPRQD